jgi:hypothetical protein
MALLQNPEHFLEKMAKQSSDLALKVPQEPA